MPTRCFSWSGIAFHCSFALALLGVGFGTGWCDDSLDTALSTIDFNDSVSPILSDKCFHCHGPDSENQQSAFRADTKDNLYADLGGYSAVVPGDLDASELHARIHSDDPALQMPPPDSQRSLSREERRILDEWIRQGAPYQTHWAFTPPQRPDVPEVETVTANATPAWKQETVERWSRNPIDAFIAKRLVAEGLAPSPPADWHHQLRRASLTLTGMLPPPELQEKITAAPTEQTYLAAVDTLLDSMAYAERQSLRWLDAARYADTDGYQVDGERTNWPWRDWVTKAFHDNMPFDQFTIEQLAGDMLPDATETQRLATTFNRNHRQNNEAGALADEFFIENVIDRVETTSTVFMGLTLTCSRCHDHKYDPLSQKEFYQFFAYFNNIGERGIGRGTTANPTLNTASPLISVPDEINERYQNAEKRLASAEAGIPSRLQTWIADNEALAQESTANDWVRLGIEDATTDGGKLKIDEHSTIEYEGPGGTGVSYEIAFDSASLGNSDSTFEIAAIRIEAVADDRFSAPNRFAKSVNGNFVLTEVEIFQDENKVPLRKATATYEQSGYPASSTIDGKPNSGWAVYDAKAESVALTLELASPLPLTRQKPYHLVMRFDSEFANHHIGKFSIDAINPDGLKGLADRVVDTPTLAILKKKADERSDEDRQKLETLYQTIDEPLKKAREELAAAKKAIQDAGGGSVTTMVMKERDGEPTPAYLLIRGQYDAPDQSEVLSRGVPAALLAAADAHQPSDRLELARWMTSPDNPLTARVTVNRFWQDHFGTGLVKTTEDFGLQGETPSHPSLLDWLATEFMESGWDVKSLHRLIVTSAAYRQTSRCTGELYEKDPGNRLFARGPRYRTDGFTIRDVALQASGLLVDQPGGPSVYPYQPAGLWESVAAGPGQRYPVGKGDNLYRKSMYSYWKRAVNPPRQTIFDAGGREVCNVRVRRTNTPLQALAMMNDPTFVEAARNLAQSILAQPNRRDEQRVAEIYTAAMALPIDEPTQNVLLDNLNFFRDHFGSRPEDAARLVSVGESKHDEKLTVTELAALTAVAHLVFNLDEFISVQ